MGSSYPDRESCENDTIDVDSDITDIEEDEDDAEKPALSKDEKRLFSEAVERIEGNMIDKLKVDQCKAYLRRHNMLLSGKKQDLLDRIKLHRQLLSGALKAQYAVQTFCIRCTGDACIGDVVLFRHRVYEKNCYLTRTKSIGVRRVAGRIVKESYGAHKQQHTFTIEVLWSTGVKPLGPLHKLLIKGRNLYRMNTFRQSWPDEAKRIEVLDEKHRRGNEARLKRAATRKPKCKVNAKVSGTAVRGQQQRQGAKQNRPVPAGGSQTACKETVVRATPADEPGIDLMQNPAVQREHKSRIKQASPQAVKPVKAKETGSKRRSKAVLPTHKPGINLTKSPVVQREHKSRSNCGKEQAAPQAVKPVKAKHEASKQTKPMLQMINVPYSAKVADVHAFLKYHQVAASKVHVLKRNNRSRGRVDLEFKSNDQAEQAMAVLQYEYLGSRQIYLREKLRR